MFYFVWASRLFSFDYEFDHVTITDDSNLESEGGTLFVKVLVQKIFKSKTECHNFYMLAST